ncbi:MAG: sulfurtransferase-like selenium metabolism protein YedF [Pseudomonadota bacterium]
MKEIDCRGQACPAPVINTKNALSELAGGGRLRVLADNEASAGNVRSFSEGQGHEVSMEEKDGVWAVTIVKRGEGGGTDSIACEREHRKGEGTVVVISSDEMGSGAVDLGKILIQSFFKTLKDIDPGPGKIIFYNSGVYLLAEGSGPLEEIKALEAGGIEILACGTCLEYYKLKEKLAVGRISNMVEIAGSMLGADRVIKP